MASSLRLSIADDALFGARHLLLQMYGGSQFATLDELRAHLYCSRNVKDLTSLPPTENGFYQHMLCVTYQVYTWKKALDGSVNIANPLDFGWLLHEDHLKPRYMTKPHCPPDLSTKSSCPCMKGRCAKSCSCEYAGPCIVACLCGSNPDRCDRIKQVELLQIGRAHV